MTSYLYIAFAALLLWRVWRRPRLFRTVEITGTIKAHSVKTNRAGICTAFYTMEIDGFERAQTIPICPAFHFPDWLTTGVRFHTLIFRRDHQQQNLTAYSFGKFTQIEETCPV